MTNTRKENCSDAYRIAFLRSSVLTLSIIEAALKGQRIGDLTHLVTIRKNIIETSAR